MGTGNAARAAPDDERYVAVVREAIAHLEQGTTLGELAGLTDQDFEVLYAHAYTLYQSGQYIDALRAFADLCRLRHLDRRCILGFGMCLHTLGRCEEAIKYYIAAAGMDLDDPMPPFHVAECLLTLGQVEAACEGFAAIVGMERQGSTSHPAYARARAMLELLSRVSETRKKDRP